MRLSALAVLFGLLTLPTLLRAQPSQADRWDVAAAHGPTQTVRFTTTEGTWMNLDVSPDGREIVFDLLGDLYVLPVEGGKARRLTSGPAFDVQPRFSPDGRQIAFTSDRAGGDNLWVMNRDGSGARQVTKEDFRLVNGPAWTPDGQYLLGRKHFTSTRSLGAGEVWMYHVAGGSGFQLTKRKNDQQDQGNEIALSPDGRYVYFSEDVSGGSTFEYNKDPNGQIYVVRRLDRQTGEIDNLITGAGGAVRPTPSPDGSTIAFVRRVRDESVLYLYDLASGAQIPVWDGLSHDQQEAWAIFGVYPAFDWLPDGRHVVLWARGGLWKVDLGQRSATRIPFEADVEQALTEPVRFAHEVAPATFQAKMIRDVATSPDGRTVVFGAAGHLYVKRLPEGVPRRLTRDAHFEFDPAFSPDGKSLVYTTWSDAELSTIYRIDLDGRNQRRLTTRPGYYHTPRFSPDGTRIVYRRGGGNAMLGFVHGVDQGLYTMPAGGGPPTLVAESGEEPQFDATGSRLFFLTGGGLSKQLKSIRLDGADERVHLALKYPSSVVVSPDGRWVAWTELFNAYVAPLPQTGGAIELSKDMKGVPVKQVTRDAGTDLHWSPDGQTLHWVIGPTYFSRRLADTFAFVDGAPAEIPGPDTTGIDLGLVLTTYKPEGTLALTGARLITMKGDEVIEDGTLVVRGDRIVAVGPSSQVAVPAGARRLDMKGKTIIPGLVDVHAHVGHFYEGFVPQQNWSYYVNLAYGVTTTHDPSANTETVFTLSEMVRSGQAVGPRIFSTGTILYGADGDFKAVVNSLDDARSHLRRMKAVGAFSVKSYNQPRRDQRQQVLQAARELGMLVVPEGGSTFFHNLTQIVDGHTGVEHNLPVAPLYADVLNVWKATPVGYTPTLVVSYGGLSGEYYWYQHTDVFDKARLLAFTPRPIVDARARRRQMAPESEYWHVEVAKAAKALVDAGGKVQMGAHGQLQGLGAHWELWMLAQGGMTPLEVLRAGTRSGAEYLGLDGDLGSLEAGKLADLVVLDANPLENIRHTEQVRYTMVGGRLFEAATMNEIGLREHARSPFYWERAETSDAFVWQGPGIGFVGDTCSCHRH